MRKSSLFERVRRFFARLFGPQTGRHDADPYVGVREPRRRNPRGGRHSAVALDEPDN